MPSQDPRNRPTPGQTTVIMPEPVTIGPAQTPTLEHEPPTVPAGETRYRVQVLAAVSRANALRLRGTLADDLGLDAYIELEQGIWKVRVGNDEDRSVARALCRRLVGLGYEDAFIVECGSR